MKSGHVRTRSANMGDIGSTYAYMRVFGYVILDLGRYSKLQNPDIRIPVEITEVSTTEEACDYTICIL